MDSRKCKVCQEVKPLTDFYHRTKDNNIFYYTRCKECERIARAPDQKAYREANKEKIAQKKKEYAQENKEHCKEVKKKYYEENKEKLSEKGKVKVVCSVCGTEIRKDGLKRHMTIHDPKNYKNGLRIY